MVEVAESQVNDSAPQPAADPIADKSGSGKPFARLGKLKGIFSIKGLGALLFGVLVPALLIGSYALCCFERTVRLVIKHPIETLLECALVVAVPIINGLIFRSLSRDDRRFAIRRGLLNGLSIGTSLVISLLCGTALCLGYPTEDPATGQSHAGVFFIITLISSLACGTAIYLGNQLRTAWDLRSARLRSALFSVSGAMLALLAFAGAEARSVGIRLAEQKAISHNLDERRAGLQLLRSLNAERDLIIEGADPRTAGIPGMFIKIDSENMRPLYFALTGKPYRAENEENFATLSDEYLRKHVVGLPIEGLTLQRSSLTGVAHGQTLTSRVDWTFIFGNDSYQDQEARAEISLPPGAVIAGLMAWKDGKRGAGTFCASGDSGAANQYLTANHETPAIVTDLGRGRVLLHCYPVPAHSEMKVQVSIVTPLKPDSNKSASMQLPRLTNANFTVLSENILSLRTAGAFAPSMKDAKVTRLSTGENSLIRTLKKEELSGAALSVSFASFRDFQPLAVNDPVWERKKLAEKQQREALAETAEPEAPVEEKIQPKHLMVLFDGSENVREVMSDVARAVSQMSDKTLGINQKPFARKVPSKKKPEETNFYMVEHIRQVASHAPHDLLVVLDGSQAVGQYLPEIKTALSAVPAQVNAKILVASEGNAALKAVPLSAGLNTLDAAAFSGGQDNLQAMVKASELAGESTDGAVLWIHGPQPGYNKEIFTMIPYTVKPRFFELALDNGETDTRDFLKNHDQIGPVTMIPRTDSVKNDLGSFFTHWRSGQRELVVSYERTKDYKGSVLGDWEAEVEVSALWANRVCTEFLARGLTADAARLAARYGIVTPVSLVVVQSFSEVTQSQTGGDLKAAGEGESAIGQSPMLQGATNGTIGPQDGDATVVQGVNTAGTVRVNNLANLEAMLNIFCNLAEILGIVAGGGLILSAALSQNQQMRILGMDLAIGRKIRVWTGVSLIMLGLITPSFMNYLVASARDANLFA